MSGKILLAWCTAAAVTFTAAAWLGHRMNDDSRQDAGQDEPVRITDSRVSYQHDSQVFTADYAVHNDQPHPVTYRIVFDFGNGTTRSVHKRVETRATTEGSVSVPYEKSYPGDEGTPSTVHISEITTTE
ncbi:hypothetical protein AB0E10_29260 [Streptomyces sp. NPDC048045]|uniref:hypothetical protein n=1 Tax=Streptomyces sp. NPDC048045 TaxID=3154710 RepID=UPI0034178BB9